MSCFGKCLDLNKSVRLEIAFANSDNDLIANPIEINNTFKNYFLNLYTSESPESNSVMLEFLDNVDIPTLNSEQKTCLDKHIQEEDILNAISLMQNKKTPGPDGYPIDFYKKNCR